MSSIIESVSVVDAIERRIKQKIATGQLQPGQQLASERELQAELGVSRLPLREALARLQALGLIRIRHGKGAFVERGVSSSALADVLITFFPQQDANRLQDLVEARGLLESELSALASARATGEDLANLEELLRSDPDSIFKAQEFADLDYMFHHQIATIAGNSFLLLMHEALGPHIRSFLMAYANTDDARRLAHARNLSLLEAIKSKDPKFAAETARDHLKPCLKSIIKTVASPKSAPDSHAATTV